MSTALPQRRRAADPNFLQGSVPIHTSDRLLFKRCRRKWNWSSPIRQGLLPLGDTPIAFWFGSGFHYALEDYHGYNKHGAPQEALKAYFKAHRQSELPSGAEQELELGIKMFDHYLQWLKHRNEYATVWVDDQPQVEVNFAIPLPDLPGVHYAGTFDRIVRDPFDRLWILDYKTAQRFDTSKLEMDPQVSAYCWAAEQLYPGTHFEGMLYIQFLKAAPHPPRLLVNGDFSTAKNQNTTHYLFKRALLEAGHKTVRGKYLEYLNYLATLEQPDADKFIRRDLVRRNDHQKASAYRQIVAEAREMLNPDIPIYPNPTRDCVWDCPFRAPCIAMDDGSDSEFLLREGYQPAELRDSWKSRLERQLSQPTDEQEQELDFTNNTATGTGDVS